MSAEPPYAGSDEPARLAPATPTRPQPTPTGEEWLERAWRVEQMLRARAAALHAALGAAPDPDPELRRRADALRDRIAEYLERPGGYHARAVRALPPSGPAAAARVDAALRRGESLHEEAGRLLEAGRARAALTQRLRELEHDFARRLPAAWRRVTAGGALRDAIERAAGPRAAVALAEHLTFCERVLAGRAAALEALEAELVRRLPDAYHDTADRDVDLERRVEGLMQYATEYAASMRAESAATFARARAAHLGSTAPARAAGQGRPHA